MPLLSGLGYIFIFSNSQFAQQTIFPTFENPVTALDPNRFPFTEILEIAIVCECLYAFM